MRLRPRDDRKLVWRLTKGYWRASASQETKHASSNTKWRTLLRESVSIFFMGAPRGVQSEVWGCFCVQGVE